MDSSEKWVVAIPHPNYITIISGKEFQVNNFCFSATANDIVKNEVSIQSCSVACAAQRLALFGRQEMRAMLHFCEGTPCDTTDTQNVVGTNNVHVAVLWCLCPLTKYTICLSSKAPHGGLERTTIVAATLLFTDEFLFRFFNPSVQPFCIGDWSLLFHPLVLGMICHNHGGSDADNSSPSGDSRPHDRSGDDNEFFYLCASPMTNFFSITPRLLRQIYYWGLFSLHDVLQRGRDTAPAHMLVLPNGSQRFILDLEELRSRYGGEGGGGKLPVLNKKVRRAIKDRQLRLRVREDKKGLAESLRMCKDYHVQKHGRTWLTDELIELLSATSSHAGVSNEPNENVRMLTIELVRERLGGGDYDVLAGCCSFSLGALFHDYSMYTPSSLPASVDSSCESPGEEQAAHVSYGSVLTRIIFDALYHCGYDMWYWGFKIDYMEEYEKKYGGKDVSRCSFYKRWMAHRDRGYETAENSASVDEGHNNSPSFVLVSEYLKLNKGLIPCI